MKTMMPRLAVLIVVAAGALARANAEEKPAVTLEPFEPTYKVGDKFNHPEEVVAPRFLWPLEVNRSVISGETVILVELDSQGQAKRLATLYSTHPLFARAAIQALQKARWNSTKTEWFYYKAVFDVTKDEPNERSADNDGAAPGRV